LGTELNAKNKIQAIGSLAVPGLRYSFGIVNWNQEELQKLDQKTRKLLIIHGPHHPSQGVIFRPWNFKTCLKRNAIVPVFLSVFTGFRFTKGCVLIKQSTKNMIA
jgi:hypothetical protein